MIPASVTLWAVLCAEPNPSGLAPVIASSGGCHPQAPAHSIHFFAGRLCIEGLVSFTFPCRHQPPGCMSTHCPAGIRGVNGTHACVGYRSDPSAYTGSITKTAVNAA